jgi:class 3 adenylate cyclase
MAGALGRFEDAERHFATALRMNQALESAPLVAETNLRHAEALARRDAPGDREQAVEMTAEALDTAQGLGVPALVERAFALKLKLQGIDTADVRSSIDAVAEAVEDERPDLSTAAAPDGTVTILFSDIEGSTAMTERLGDRRWLEVLRGHNAIVRAQVGEHGGFEVKSQGDGFMVAFSSARRALDCAISVQRAFAAEAEEQADEAVRVRIGMHTGEAIREQDDFFGRNVILAARIAAQADGGEILVSSLLKELAESSGDIAFGEAREVALKGLTGTYRLHAVDWGRVGAGAAG